jgi:ABC-2 type transport system permease protein
MTRQDVRLHVNSVIDAMRREWRVMKADSNILLVLTAAPLAYLLLFGSVYFNKKVYDVPIMVVDLDRSQLSRTIIRSLDANEALRVVQVGADESEIRRRLTDETVWGAVVIPRDCERTIKQGHHVNILMYANAASIVVFDHAQTGLQSVLGSAAAGVSMEKMILRNGTNLMAYESYMPVEPVTRVLFNPSLNYSNFILPILFMILLHQVIALGSGMSWALAYESEEGTKHKPEGDEIVGRIMAYAFPTVFWLGVEVVVFHRWPEVPFHGGAIVLVVFGLCLGLIAALLGAILGSLIRSKVGVVQMLFFYSMPAVLISGAVWPLESMPVYLRWLALALPSTHIIRMYQMLMHGIAPAADYLSMFGLLFGFILILGTILHLVTRKR